MENLQGILVKVTGGFYYVEVADKIYECKARGIFRKRNCSPYVGDHVEILVPKDGYASIENICQRKNSLIRPPLANLDILFVVCSTVDPAPNSLVVDKMVSAAVNKDIEPVIVISKTDICDNSEFVNTYKNAGIKAIEYSSVTKAGTDEILQLLSNKVSAFIGNSGVGKSTLLNVLFPNLHLQTGDISQKLGRGRHTTRTVELFKINNGYVADTPGFSTVDLERYEIIDKENLQFCFPEFEKYIGKCKFSSCSHRCEKGCAIVEAVQNGEISDSRHNSYITMYNEVNEIKPWELK